MSVNVSALRRGRRHRAHVTRCGGQISWRCRPCMPRGGGLAWSPLPPRRIYPENIQPRSRETGACARVRVCVFGGRGGGDLEERVAGRKLPLVRPARRRLQQNGPTSSERRGEEKQRCAQSIHQYSAHSPRDDGGIATVLRRVPQVDEALHPQAPVTDNQKVRNDPGSSQQVSKWK